MQAFFDKIKDIDLVDAIGKYVDLKRTGASYKANCPFPGHDENTPSFVVNPGKHMFKCFGCGKGGTNAATFLMEVQGISWWDACVILAKDFNIDIPNTKERTPEEEEEYKKHEAVKMVLKFAMEYFQEQLQENKPALKYAQGRWTDETIKDFNIGYAPAGNAFYKEARLKGYKIDLLLDADLIKASKNQKGTYYDTFRERIMFPMADKYGRPVGFSGRILPQVAAKKTEIAKYMNSRESDLFQKGKMFFGFHLAQRVMRDKKMAYLVEGHPDVVRMHEIDQVNTVATSGTALTSDQVFILKSLVESVNIIGDTDDAGLKATKRSAEMLIKEGLFVNVVDLPDTEDGKKNDPDSFFTTPEQFDEFVTGEHIRDYIYTKANKWQKRANNPDFKKRALDEICELVACLPVTIHGMYMEQLGKIIPSKKVWDQTLKAILKEKEPEVKESRIPDHVKLSDFEKYGFYADHNKYFFKGRNGTSEGSNFIMKPLFHVQSVSNAKRIYEITNEFGYSQVIEFAQKDLLALSRFRERLEGLGNFIWKAQEGELTRLKCYLYENTESCVEITQLGWQKHGFWAWGNGLFNGQFNHTNEYGIVKHEDKNYYLPAFSKVYDGEDGLFTAERRFMHRKEEKISLNAYSEKLMQVFGENAKFGICFYLSTLFRDHIVKIFNFYPILNLFGPKGAGKTELAVSLLQFFGPQPKGPNINNTSKAALADHVAMSCNALCHIDEYKNNLDFEKIEFLKGLWDGTGRTRMNMDKDKKKETTAVDAGIIVSGQEMPTADIALFSRLIYLTFSKTIYTEQEKENFNELKKIEKKGLTHITHKILEHRVSFLENFMKSYDLVSRDVQNKLKEQIEDRILKNWLIPIAAFHALQEKITLPFTYKQLINEAVVHIAGQNSETGNSNEVTAFWDTVQYMFENNLIQHGVDYRIDFGETNLKTKTMDAEWSNAPKDVLNIRFSKIMTLYAIVGRQSDAKVLPKATMEYYLKNDKSFFGIRNSYRFYISDKMGNILLDDVGIRKETITSAYSFDYNKLDIVLHDNKTDKEEKDKIELEKELKENINDKNINGVNSKNEPDEELPF